jgi:hypothetical protein
MDPRDQRTYYNRCRPDEPLKPDDARNVDLDAYDVRGRSWAETLARRIGFAVADDAVEEPACEFFTGLPGSGKSTEILRLARLLQERSNLLVVRIDAQEVLDLTERIDVSDIRVAIWHHAERAVLQAEGRSGDDALKEGPLDRLGQLLTRLKPGGKAELGVPGAKLALEMKLQPSLRQEVQKRVAAHLATFLREADYELVLLKDRAKRCGKAGLVVLFDSLEKLRGISSNFEQVLESAERLFSGGAPYLKLPVHALYTLPPALILRLRVPVQFMPMIKLWHQDGTPFPPGAHAARKLIAQRVPEAQLAEFFGAENRDVLEDRLHRLIQWSAGYPRELVRLLQNAILDAPLNEATFRRLLGQAGDDYRRVVATSDLELLARVAQHGTLTPESDAERLLADRLLTSNVVLCYQNDSQWFGLHPAVRELPGLAETIERQRRPLDKGPLPQ